MSPWTHKSENNESRPKSMSPAFKINKSHFDLLANILLFKHFFDTSKNKSFYYNMALCNQLAVNPLFQRKKLFIQFYHKTQVIVFFLYKLPPLSICNTDFIAKIVRLVKPYTPTTF